jgi:hypothetical protein
MTFDNAQTTDIAGQQDKVREGPFHFLSFGDQARNAVSWSSPSQAFGLCIPDDDSLLRMVSTTLCRQLDVCSLNRALRRCDCTVVAARIEGKQTRQPTMRCEPHRLVFIDETGTTTKMTRPCG